MELNRVPVLVTSMHRAVPRLVGVALIGSLAIVLLVVVGVLPLLASPYVINLAFLVLFYGVLTLGLNIFTGLTGYVNFGYTAFVGIGAYAMAISTWKLGVPFPVGFPIAAAVSALFSLLIGMPLLRIRGIYFAIATVGIAAALQPLMLSEYLEGLTNGVRGITISTGLGLTAQYYILAGFALTVLLGTLSILSTKFGLQLLAIRDDELAAQALGIPTGAWKLLAFVLSGTVGGLAGAIFAIYLTFVEPSLVFDLNLSLRPLVMLLFGGFGTVFGPLLGAVLFTLISEIVWSRFLTYHLLVFGIVLVLLVLLMPQGIVLWLQSQRLLPRTRAL